MAVIKNKIDNDFRSLRKSGLQVRYITTIPKILQNIYQYYKIENESETSVDLWSQKAKGLK